MAALKPHIKLALLGIFIIFCLLFLSSNTDHQNTIKKVFNHRSRVPIFEKWHNCATSSFNFSETADQFWKSCINHVKKCDKLIDSNVSMKLRPFRNKDEYKYAVLPLIGMVEPEVEDYVVTIGIGKDVKAETALKNETEELGANTKFFGADPMFMDNFDIFSTIGTFFPLAISGSDGFFEASVLFKKKYKNVEVFHINLVYFIKNILKIRIIDHLWMDNEYGEYSLFPYFHENGQLDEAGITVCQLNMEVHKASADQQELFKEFIRRLLEDRRYALLKQVTAAKHHRLYFFNFGNDYCVNKFIEMK